MPTYDYKCLTEECEYHAEINVPIDDRDKPLKDPCPLCGNLTVTREFGSPLVNLSCRWSTIQSHPTNRKFKETVLDPIKRGLNKTGRVKAIE